MFFDKGSNTWKPLSKKKLPKIKEKIVKVGKIVGKTLNKKKFKVGAAVLGSAAIYNYGKKNGRKAERRRMLAVTH
jgi:hypothetical protein